MLKNLKTIILLALIFAIYFISNANANQIIDIQIDGETINFNEETGIPFVDENSRTQVPFRVVLEEIGAIVSWDNTNNIAVAIKDDDIVEIPIGEDFIIRNEVIIKNDTKAIIKNGRTYLPIKIVKIVMESFGYSVNWESRTKTVMVISNANYHTSNKGYHIEDLGYTVRFPQKYEKDTFDEIILLSSAKNEINNIQIKTNGNFTYVCICTGENIDITYHPVLFLQGFKRENIQDNNDIVNIGGKDYKIQELEDMLVFNNEEVLIYNISSLVTNKSFKGLLSDYIEENSVLVGNYDFTHAYKLGEYLIGNIKELIVRKPKII